MSCIELCIDPRHSNASTWRKAPEEIRNVLNELGVVVNSIHVPLPKESANASYDQLNDLWMAAGRASIDLAVILGASFIVQHIRMYEEAGGSVRNTRTRRWLPDLRGLAEYAVGQHVRVAVENTPGSSAGVAGATVETVGQLVHDRDAEIVGICCDLSHCVASGEDPVEALKSINLRRLISVHASDNHMGRDEDMHLPIGTGDIPWRSVVSVLHESDFRGSFVIEVAEGVDGRSALRSSLDFLRKLHMLENQP